MGTSNEKIVDCLNSLIHLDADAVELYQSAIDRIDDDPSARSDLESFKADHQRHIVDLTRVVRNLGGEPASGEQDLKGKALEAMTALRSMTGTAGALKAMRMNEKLTNKTYDDALDQDLPAVALAIVTKNRDDERRHLAAIERHLERITGSKDEDRDVSEVDGEYGDDLGEPTMRH
jgi:uncharacterized protein (TIGR02284 family)